MLRLLVQMIQQHILNRIITILVSLLSAATGVLLARVPRPLTLALALGLIAGAVWAFGKAVQRRPPVGPQG